MQKEETNSVEEFLDLPKRPLKKEPHLEPPNPPKVSKRAPFTERELEYVAALSVNPGKMPPLHPIRALKVIKEAKRIFNRRRELARTRIPRQTRARAKAMRARRA